MEFQRPPRFIERLEQLKKRNLHRSVRERAGIDFSSNDYLGFAQDEAFSKKAWEACSSLFTGSSGSRLVRGHAEVFEKSERSLAEFSGQQAALIFPSTYQANLALFSSILGEEDQVFSDELNHASIIDGIRLSRAQKIIFPHLDLAALERALMKAPPAPKDDSIRVIAIEGLYSMQGDRAPLEDLCALAERFGAWVILDDAHLTGLRLDEEKRPLSHPRILAITQSGGKALGVSGGWIACSSLLKEWLINTARPWIFTTAPSPWLPELLFQSIHHWQTVGADRIRGLKKNCVYLKNKLAGYALFHPVEGPIFPLIIGDSQKALSISEQLLNAGFDLRAIRPPTVPDGSARLRLTLHANQETSELDRLVDALSPFLGERFS